MRDEERAPNEDPDWIRYGGVHSRAADPAGVSQTPLGDATLWGNNSRVRIPLDALGQFATQQLVRVQTVDQYSRNWHILGNVVAEQEFWDASDTNVTIALEVTMGVGYATVLQQFNLRALVALADPWYLDGQNGNRVVKSWVISGGLIGRALSARVVINTLIAPVLEDDQFVDVSALISPFAAGFGI